MHTSVVKFLCRQTTQFSKLYLSFITAISARCQLTYGHLEVWRQLCNYIVTQRILTLLDSILQTAVHSLNPETTEVLSINNVALAHADILHIISFNNSNKIIIL